MNWFDDGYLVREITREQALRACHRGDCREDVRALAAELDFDAPVGMAVEALARTGTWERDELLRMTGRELAAALLWVVCGEIKDGADCGLICLRGQEAHHG